MKLLNVEQFQDQDFVLKTNAYFLNSGIECTKIFNYKRILKEEIILWKIKKPFYYRKMVFLCV